MLSLKDFKKFEVNQTLKVVGGQATQHTLGTDEIHSDSGGDYMTINGDFAGCRCGSSSSFSTPCCNQQ